MVDKGDHIRLADLQLSYDVDNKRVTRWHMRSLRLYLYANNIGLLWKANHDGIDPDYVPGDGNAVYPNPRSIAIGIKAEF